MAGSAAKSGGKYRFRVRTASGEEVISNVIELGARDAGLKNPRWADGKKPMVTKHNDDMQMQVDAPGFDGRKVRFLVERLTGGKWGAYTRAVGTVKSGVATATIQAAHPGAESSAPSKATLAPVPMRFKVEFV